MEPGNILHVHDLAVELDGKRIIHDVSFFVKPQEVLAIVGPNGAGKSVLLKTLVGLLKPTTGWVEWQDGIRIGYLPQRFHVERYLPMTVEEFLKLKPVHSYTLPEVLALVGLDVSWLSRSLAHLSSGQLQKVLLAWTLLDKPHVLLFDEPTENVDVVGQESIYTLLHMLQDELGISLIIVSHDLHVVFRYANKVVCLNEKMVCYGEPESALTNARLSELYGDHAFFHHHHFSDARHDHHDD
jgi:zinc transport system ATP-binding protein